MHFFGSGVAQQLYNPGAGSAAHDGIINQHHAFILHCFANHIQFDFYGGFSQLLAGSDKAASDVFVFQKTDTVRKPAFLRKTNGRINA